MEIVIKRIAKKEGDTIGHLSINDRRVCDTLEPHCIDWQKERKVEGRTAIPEGRYRVEVRYSRRFERQLPFLLDVPHFEGIMIHQGNTPSNTKGCILVGHNTIRGLVLKSRQAMEKMMEQIRNAKRSGQEVWCEVR